MNYVEWCELVMNKLDAESDRNEYVRNYGIDTGRMEKLIWEDQYDEVKAFLKENKYKYVLDDAIFDLEKLGLIEDGNSQFHKLTLNGRAAVKDLPALWEEICSRSLPSRQRQLLEAINRVSEKEDEKFARVEMVEDYQIYGAVGEIDESFNLLNDQDLAELLCDLRSRGLIFCERGEYPDEARANYFGLVWQRQREFVLGVREIDSLVEVWETTSVDFKRELYLDTASEKAEFVKDILGLANTQASGQRWLIVGFDDKTRDYYIPPKMPEKGFWFEKINQDRIEQILSNYVTPNIEIRYEVVNYKGGKVSKIEVLRDAKKLPYRVAKSLGDKKDKKRIEENQIFVRHGSHTVEPGQEELQDLYNEAARTKSL